MILYEKILIDRMFSFGEEQSLKFAKGLVLVEGDNVDRGGSNGAGKSNLFRALTTVQFEENDINWVKDDALNQLYDSGRIELEFVKDGKHYRVIYRRGNGATVDLYCDGKDMRGRSISDTLSKLKTIIGMSYEEFIAVSYLEQGKFLKFVDGTDKDRMEILSAFLGLLQYDKLADIVKKDQKEKLAEYEKRVFGLKAVEQYSEEGLKKLQDTYYSKKAKIDELKRELQKHSDGLQRLKKEMEYAGNFMEKSREEQVQYEKVKVLYEVYAKEVAALEAKLPLFDEKRYEVDKQNYTHKAEDLTRGAVAFENATKILQNIKAGAGKCDACGSIVSGKHLKEYKLSIEKEKDVSLDMWRSLETEVKELEISLAGQEKVKQEKYAYLSKISSDKEAMQKINIAEVENKLGQLDEQMKKYSQAFDTLSGEVEKQSAEIAKWNQEYSAESYGFGQIDQELKQYVNSLELKRKYTQELKAADSVIEMAKFWVSALGDKGIKRYKVNKYVSLLNNLINNRLHLLTNGVMSVKFTAFDENEKGDVMARFNLAVNNGKIAGLPFRACSGGEKQVIALAVFAAFWELAYKSGRATNVLILDEVTAALDEPARYAFVEFLQEFKKYDVNVFVVAHSQDVKDMGDWDQVLVVRKSGGVSKIEIGGTNAIDRSTFAA